MLRSSGAPGFKKFLSSSLSLFDFIWAAHTAGRDFETPESRAGLTKALQKQIATIADPEIQKHYKELIRSRISESFFKSYQGKGAAGGRGGRKMKPTTALRVRPMLQKKNRMAQKILLACVVNNPMLYNVVEEEFGQFVIEDQNLNNFRQYVITSLSEDPELDTEGLCSKLESCGFEKEIDDILNESVYVHAAFSRKGALDTIGEISMQSQWVSYYEGLQGQGLSEEVKAGWKSAFESSNEQQEDRLRDMVRIKSSE